MITKSKLFYFFIGFLLSLLLISCGDPWDSWPNHWFSDTYGSYFSYTSHGYYEFSYDSREYVFLWYEKEVWEDSYALSMGTRGTYSLNGDVFLINIDKHFAGNWESYYAPEYTINASFWGTNLTLYNVPFEVAFGISDSTMISSLEFYQSPPD